MKKLLSILVVLSPLFVCAQNSAINQAVNHAFNQAVDRAVSAQTAQVYVWVKLAKPVYMSDVMFRRPRGKDVVIRLDYKEKRCFGRVFPQKKQVYVPVSCVLEDKYRAHQIILKFASGNLVRKSAKDVQVAENIASISL